MPEVIFVCVHNLDAARWLRGLLDLRSPADQDLATVRRIRDDRRAIAGAGLDMLVRGDELLRRRSASSALD